MYCATAQKHLVLIACLCLVSAGARASTAPEGTERLASSQAPIVVDDEPSCLQSGTTQGAAWGCGVCAGVPDLVILGGWAFLGSMLALASAQGGSEACGTAFVGIVFGGIPAVVGTWIAGPLGPLAVIIGGSVGASLDGRAWWPALVGGVPGLLLGTAGSAMGLLLFVLNQPDLAGSDQLPGDIVVPLLGLGSALVILAGPLALVGVALADHLWGAPDRPTGAQPVAPASPTPAPGSQPAAPASPAPAPGSQPAAPASPAPASLPLAPTALQRAQAPAAPEGFNY